MKIVHLSNVVGKFGGGVAQVVEALFSIQTELGYNPALWFAGEKTQESEVLRGVVDDVCAVTAIEHSILGFPYFFGKLRRIKDDSMIIHQHGVFLPISLLSLTSRKNIKVIISPHGYLEPEKMKVSSFRKKIVLGLFEYRNLRNSSCLIACSMQEAVALRDFGLRQPIAILPNGVDEALIRRGKIARANMLMKTKYLADPDTKVLLFLSRIHPFKGLELFLRTVLSMKTVFKDCNWVVFIAGIDELGHEKKLKNFVVENELSELVFFVGPQYGQDKINAFDSADCFILPSKGENFGIAVIEALSRGLPVITTRSTPWEELVFNNCGWWVHRSEEGFRDALLGLFSKNTDDLVEMGKNGIELVEENYTWPRIVAQSLQIYKWVVSDFNEASLTGFKVFNS